MDFATYFNARDPNVRFHAIRNEILQTCNDPQIVEIPTHETVILYIRFYNGEIVCLNKATGEYICSGSPFLKKTAISLTIEEIEFYLEMYSKHLIKFV